VIAKNLQPVVEVTLVTLWVLLVPQHQRQRRHFQEDHLGRSTALSPGTLKCLRIWACFMFVSYPSNYCTASCELTHRSTYKDEGGQR
jgi:hypothetical protein